MWSICGRSGARPYAPFWCARAGNASSPIMGRTPSPWEGSAHGAMSSVSSARPYAPFWCARAGNASSPVVGRTPSPWEGSAHGATPSGFTSRWSSRVSFSGSASRLACEAARLFSGSASRLACEAAHMYSLFSPEYILLLFIISRNSPCSSQIQMNHYF
jgi:hypothetical protein